MTEAARVPVAIIGVGYWPALQEFLAAAPVDSGIVYLVVSAAPLPDDALGLLQPHTALPVHRVEGTAALAPDHVYLLAPTQTVTSFTLPCQLSTAPALSPAPIDACCKLLAPLLGACTLGVVLGGAGADGALGLTHVREAGGLAAVQEPGSTVAASMPLQALAVGQVDLVLPPAALAAALRRYAGQLAAVPPPAGESPPVGELPPASLQQLLQVQAHLLRHTGQDFRPYQPLFLLRKVEKRRRLLALPSLGDYIRLLDEQPHEAVLLRDEALSCARQFWRQPQSLDLLAEHALGPLLSAKSSADLLRVWVVGCGAGEEAYTIGMLLLEAAAAAGNQVEVRLFATDASSGVIDQARAGLFPSTIIADLGEERVRRFFTSEGKGLHIAPVVRQQMVFAPHDLFHTAPFLKLDLIVCRNLLGTLDPAHQQELMKLFFYSLQPSGYLLAGAGSPAPGNLFRQVAPGQPLYQRQVGARSEAVAASIPFSLTPAPALSRSGMTPEALYNIHAQRHTPPGLLVNGDGQIVYYATGAAPYLHQPGGGATDHVLQRLRPELSSALAPLLQHVLQTGQPAYSPPIPLAQPGAASQVQLCVEPVQPANQQKHLLVLLRPVEPPPAAPAPAADEIGHLKEALAAAYHELQSVSEEHAAVSEEMGVANEELLSLNEELHLKANELERNRQDLRIINEDLAAINAENQHHIDQLRQLTANLQNLMAATNIPTLFLDGALRIRWFSPALQTLFYLLPNDLGRPPGAPGAPAAL